MKIAEPREVSARMDVGRGAVWAMGVVGAAMLAGAAWAGGVGLAEPGQIGFQQAVTPIARRYSLVPRRSADADHHGDLAVRVGVCSPM